ncbi:MAG: asparagine synthase (glutamine-hydrolyzing) [Symploca sp. SIO2D2]|nr:asparagine synthase (glutamine-hydrolyzing) [Symploca sp. SIO2D2]
MCGIFGQFRQDGIVDTSNLLCHFTSLLHHRGPDGGAYWTQGSFFLGHRRLSIIDLAQGQQPMATSDGQLVVTFNGEIYNYIELREELIKLGHTFNTASDTEVLLHGYREWGVALPKRLMGMFAFAIADRKKQELFLARDRFGEKPLLYLDTPEGVTFASELRALINLPNLSKKIDEEALAHYLCLNYVPHDRTLIQDIKKLLPASWRLYSQAKVQEGIYWTPSQNITSPQLSQEINTIDDAITQLQDKLDQSVNISLRSDVPIALFLSGGIDSSVVAESAVRQGHLTQAYCLDFREASFSEWDKAQAVAKHLDIPLQRVFLSSQVLNDFFTIVGHLDDPLADSSALAVWTIARETAQKYKVVISGDGGDELFAGYLTYQATILHKLFISQLPLGIRRGIKTLADQLPNSDSKVSIAYKLMRFLRAADLPSSQAHFTWNGTWLPEEAASLVQNPIIQKLAISSMADIAARHKLDDQPSLFSLQSADVRDYLPNDILTKVDRMTMAFGLEARAPLLVPIIAEFALSLPDHLKTKLQGKPKRILRELANRIYGKQIASAKKQGFSIPIHQWLRKPGRELTETLLSKESLTSIGLFNVDAVIQAKDRHMKGQELLGFELWGLMVFVAWYQLRVSSPAIPRVSNPESTSLVKLDFG